ncbi:hypothetical protein [Bermanella sp. R86510]|uniref:hypothetical protein n=1 Tax=unclassified Bermanella TaxID=2627862 RepID=UPI0037C829B6
MSEEFLPIDRFLETLRIVSKEGVHLSYSWKRLYENTIDADYINTLNNDPEASIVLEAFVSRYGRMQDTIADKLLPRWLQALAEAPGSQIDVLNRAERLGVLEDVETWLAARKLRNRLVHEYMESEHEFASDLLLAKEFSQLFIDLYTKIRTYTKDRMQVSEEKLPQELNALQ